MQKVKSYKCPGCGMKYKSLTTWGNHLSVHHPEYIPQGWSYALSSKNCLCQTRNM